MKCKRIISALLAAAVLPALPCAAGAEGTEVPRMTIIEAAVPSEAITFTEYNDKAGGMYNICGRNRIAARTDSALPYQDERTALESARDYTKERSSRVKLLTGDGAGNQWDFTVVKNLEMGAERGLINADGTENPFAAADYRETDIWKENVPVPSSWTSYGAWWENVNTPNGEGETWVWDYPIYDNVKMPWQSGEQPYGSTDPYNSWGTLTPGEAPVKYNPIGFYRTSVSAAGLELSDGDRIRISFGGVESAYYVFIDGECIGYSEDSFRPHEFDITDRLSDGAEHTLAVRVHKFCDGTWLEDQDMIYDGGIFRDVSLISVPAVSIEDYKIETDFDESYENAELLIKELKIRNNTDKEIPAGCVVTANLYDKEDLNSVTGSAAIETAEAIPAWSEAALEDVSVAVTAPKQWSAEKPNLYILSLNLANPDGGAVMSAAQLVGFREIGFTRSITTESDSSIPESYDRITINGMPLLMKGTNRHDSDPITGKYVSKEVYDIDLKTMKQFNINTIRTSHYANDEYLYYLADTKGFYIMAETNAECHSVAQKARTDAEVYQTILRPIFLDRTETAYQTLKNHSSIVAWSIGNECGGSSAENKPVYHELFDYFHDRDATRPVHSEFMQWDGYTDMESNMYPTVQKVRSMAATPDNIPSTNSVSKPYFLCEYAHAMGNAVGDLDGYWNAIRSGTNMLGGCIWDWVDQSRIVPLSRVTSADDAIRKTDSNKNIVPNPYDYYKDGKFLAHEELYGKLREGWFFGYGGDWGDINFEGRNVAADGSASGGGAGSFCVNGLVSPDRQPQPELYEVKYQYQSFWFTETPIYEQKRLAKGGTTEDDLKAQRVVVYNENNFTNLNEYNLKWTLTENGTEIGSGVIDNLPSAEPKQAAEITVPYAAALPKTLAAGGEYKLLVELVTKADSWALNAGHEIAHEQFDLTDDILNAVCGAAPVAPAPMTVGGDGVEVTEDSDKFTVTGGSFSLEISKATGFMSNYVYNGETLIHLLKPNYGRDSHNNDGSQIDNWKYADEAKNITAVPNTISAVRGADGRYVIDVGLKLKVPYDGDEYAKELLRYTIDQSGAVTVRMYLDTTDMPNQTAGGRYITRLGTELKLDGGYENVMWYGNGVKTGTDGEYGYNYPVPEAYRERDTFAVKGIYSSTASEMYFPHADSQETGTVNNVTWAVIDNGKTALLATANESFRGMETDPNRVSNALEISALHYSTKDLRNGSPHPYELTSSESYTMEEGRTYFNIDHKSLGIGNLSCGPTQRENARINTGCIFDYEYTIKPMAAADAAAYTSASIEINAAEDTDIELPSFSTDIGHIGYTTPDRGLPSAVTIDGAEQRVTWENTIEDCDAYEDTEITGTLGDGSIISGTITVYPDNMYYFVDCSESESAELTAIGELSESLRNTEPDKIKGETDDWGLVTVSDDYGTASCADGGARYGTGYWAKTGKSIDYSFTLPAGKYTVTGGAHEFWHNNASRNMKLTVTAADGTELGTDTGTLNGKADPQILFTKMAVGFALDEETVITASVSKDSGADPVLSWIGIAQALPYSITTQSGITASADKAYAGETVTLNGNYAPGSLFVTGEGGELTEVSGGSFVMPKSNVAVTGLVNTSDTTYVVPDTVERVAGNSTDKRNYYIKDQNALGMTFTVPSGTYTSAKLHFVRQNTAGGQKTNVYDRTESGFAYENGGGYIAQYNGGTQNSLELSAAPKAGTYKLLLAYDSSVGASAAGNDYYVVNPVDNSGKRVAEKAAAGVDTLPYLILTSAGAEPTEKPSPVPAPTKEPGKDYSRKVHTGEAIDRLNTDDTFQYRFAGGTDAYMNGESETGKTYDAYLWVPKTASPDTLRGLVAIKMNLIEVPLAYSKTLRAALAKENFGILFIVDENDAIPAGYTGDGKNYKNILQGMYTETDYKGDPLFTASKYKTWDGKDAARIMDDIMKGIASVSGYECIADNTPIITIGHSAASPFGYRSGNWAYSRIIAQIDMKNGMWGDATDGSNAENDAHGFGMVPGIPSLQYAAQYTEHSTGAGRDRSVCDARYHIEHQRAVDPDQLVSHIIEWGSGHYDWSNNASEMLTRYIEKAIEYRVPDEFGGGSDSYTLNDLTETGYLMKPFEKDADGGERAAGYYRDTLKGWLSSGRSAASAGDADKKASFWYFDEELANEINAFTNYAIPESPGSNDTKIAGRTHSDYEPYMLMKDPSKSVYADTVYDFNSYISPFASFNGNMSRYGDNRFINYEKMENPSAGNGDSNPSLGASNTGNLKGYDTVTVDTYYMSRVPSVATTGGEAYDNTGDAAAVPEGAKAEVVPLIAPYELIESENIDVSGMTRDGSALADEVAAVTRSTLRFHNNRVYYSSGCKYTNEAGTKQGAFAMIYSPEVWDGDRLVSTFKSTGTGMNVPYVDTGKGTVQTLEVAPIADIDAAGRTENPRIPITYTSSDANLQKYTDVFVNYGPARAVRTVNPKDGSYSWELEILLDEIPDGAKYPIEINAVVSNLGKWEKVSGATADVTFYVTMNAVPERKPAVTGVTIDGNGVVTAVELENGDLLGGCRIYAAAYSAGRLGALTVTELDSGADSVTLDKPLALPEGAELRVFVWDGMKPLTEVYRKE